MAMRGWLLCLGSWLLGSVLMAQSASLGGDGWELRYRSGRGFELRLLGVTIGRASNVQLAAPDWTRGYYSATRGADVEADENSLTVRHRLPPERGTVTETVRQIDSHTLEWSLQAHWQSDEPAIVEWCLGIWNATMLIGATLQGEGRLATAQLQAQPITLERDLLFEGRSLIIETRLGTLSVVAEQGTPFAVLDGRGNPGRSWGKDAPALWLGTLNMPLPRGQPLELRYRMQILPKPMPTPRPTQVQDVPIEAVPDRWSPTPRAPVLIPPPKIVWQGTGTPFRLPAGQPVLVEIEGESYRPAADALARELARYGLKTVVQIAPQPSKTRALYLGGSRELQRRFPVPDRPGAYMVRVEPDRVLLIGRFEQGAFYGVQTLIQLLQPAPNLLQAEPITIIDYPDLLWRGVHLFGGPQNEFHQRLIGNLIAHLKFNHLVVECGYAQWEAIKPAWVDFSVPKSNLREIVALAQANLLEPIPLLQSLGHMAWLFRNGANLELAEDPDTPWAICPRREASRQMLRRLFDEVHEIFPHRAFHVGLDEVTARGRFPNSPECQGASVAELFVEHFRWLVSELQARGVEQVMLWSDMLLAPGEAHDGAANAPDAQSAHLTRQGVLQAMADAPKPAPELLLCDWHYTPTDPQNYRSLDLLKAAGFQRLIATTWYNPGNIYTFAQAARQRRIDGLLQSTWAGHALRELTLRNAPEQFLAYVLASIYAWNTDAPPPDQLPYDIEAFFQDRYRHEPVPLQPKAGMLIDLGGLYNLRLSDIGAGAPIELPIGRARLAGHLFQLADAADRPNALMLFSPLAPGELSQYPQEVTLPLQRKLCTLYLLHATGWQAERNEQVAQLQIEYADGSTVQQPLLYGVHVCAWNDPNPAMESPPVWSQQMGALQVRLRLLRWQNPHPDKEVRALRIVSTSAAGYMLLGLSAEECSPVPAHASAPAR
jgi:hypothetical protein